MRKTALSILIVLGMLYVPKLSFAGKVRVQKKFNQQNTFLKKHPVEKILSKRRDFDFNSRNSLKVSFVAGVEWLRILIYTRCS